MTKSFTSIIAFLIFLHGVVFAQTKAKEKNETEVMEIEKFAIKYEPKGGKNIKVPKVPVLSEAMKKTLFKAYNSDSASVNKYLTLILLKLYKYHLKCCQQSYGYDTYEGGDKEKQPILFLYFRFNKLMPAETFEVGSYLPFDLVEKNQALSQYEPIAREVQQIKSIKK